MFDFPAAAIMRSCGAMGMGTPCRSSRKTGMVSQSFDARGAGSDRGAPGREAQGLRRGTNHGPAPASGGRMSADGLRAEIELPDAVNLLHAGPEPCVFGIGLSSAAAARLGASELIIRPLGTD